MREILFRGKDIAGNWHYGVPLIFIDDYVCMTAPHTYNKSVIPETVGQFTGLTDKNGKKIFEGDIIKHFNHFDKPDEYAIYKVEFDERNCKFSGRLHKQWSAQLCKDLEKRYEVIGNIHDNLELLRPSLKPEYRDGDPDCPICPNCRTPLNEMEDCDCGQKIDWSDT